MLIIDFKSIILDFVYNFFMITLSLLLYKDTMSYKNINQTTEKQTIIFNQ